MPFDVKAAQRLCLMEVLIHAGVGLLMGAAAHSGTNDLLALSNTVIAARLPFRSASPRLPTSPRAIFFALLLSLVPLWQCPGFLAAHSLYTIAHFACIISTWAWLLVALFLQKSTENLREERIEQFISDPSAPVPPPTRGLDSPPRWLRNWSRFNFLVFALLMVTIVRWFLAVLPT